MLDSAGLRATNSPAPRPGAGTCGEVAAAFRHLRTRLAFRPCTIATAATGVQGCAQPANSSFRFQIDRSLGAKPETVLWYGQAKQQHSVLIWKWNQTLSPRRAPAEVGGRCFLRRPPRLLPDTNFTPATRYSLQEYVFYCYEMRKTSLNLLASEKAIFLKNIKKRFFLSEFEFFLCIFSLAGLFFASSIGMFVFCRQINIQLPLYKFKPKQ